MQLILMIQSSNEHYNGDCDCAVVLLSEDLVEQIRTRAALAREVAQHDESLYEISFWGNTAEFFGHELIDACQEAIETRDAAGDSNVAAETWLAELEQNGYAVIPENAALDTFESQRTECGRTIVRNVSAARDEGEIAWTAIPKHADIDVTTWGLPLTALEGLRAITPPSDGGSSTA